MAMRPQANLKMHPGRRKVTRLKDFDYSSPGAYFVTLVTQDRVPLFGRLEDDRVILSEIGKLAQQEWIKSGDMRKEIRLDEFIVMPNHLHAILFIDYLVDGRGIYVTSEGDSSTSKLEAHGRAPLRRPPRSLGSLLAAYKAATTRRIREITGNQELVVWQRNYYDQIIRDQIDLDNIREYITYNPLKLLSGEYFK